jgi:hypothetical protein
MIGIPCAKYYQLECKNRNHYYQKLLGKERATLLTSYVTILESQVVVQYIICIHIMYMILPVNSYYLMEYLLLGLYRNHTQSI